MDFKLSVSQFNIQNRLKDLDEKILYDIIIIGGGPAGLTAGVYCIRKGITTAIITSNFGGQVAETAGIENYMGYRYVEGMELVDKFREQIRQFELYYREGLGVKSIVDEGNIKRVVLNNGRQYRCKVLIVASGKSSRRLNVPGERELTGKGVAYCAVCDAPFYKDRKVAVAGGGNSGVEAAIDLVKIATHVTLLQNTGSLTADKILTDKLKAFDNLDILYDSMVERINGTDKVDSVEIHNIKTNEKYSLPMDGIFVEIGLIPNSDFAKGVLDLNEFGVIIIDSQCSTNVSGIFAAGDVTNVDQKQIIIAAGEGAKAALGSYEYLLKLSN